MKLATWYLSIAWILSMTSVPAYAQIERCVDGDAAMRGDRHTEAVEHYTACLDHAALDDPSRARTLQVRAAIYAEFNLWQAALGDQKASLALAPPEDVWPWVMLSVYHRELKQYEPALEALHSAMAHDEDGPGTGPGMAVHYHMGQTFHAMGRYREAVEAYTLGIPKQPDFGYAIYRRALAYEALGDRTMAKRDLFRVKELEPRDGYEADVAAKLKEYALEVRKVKANPED